MSSEFGKLCHISIFGQSHSEGIGVVIDGIPAGERFDLKRVREFMERRAPGRAAYSTPRKEADLPRILSGLLPSEEEDIFFSCGAPVCAVIENTNTRSGDYAKLKTTPRPSHADYTAYVKYKGFHDLRGGGHFSGRLTAPLCFAGALCIQLLERAGIRIGAHIASVQEIADIPYPACEISAEELLLAGRRAFPVNDEACGRKMQERIDALRALGDSAGGIVECAVTGLMCGLGEPMFDGTENRIAQALFAVPAVKGVEFGAGFAAAGMRGSEQNDAFCLRNGSVVTKTNHSGGILGGITNGMPLIVRAAFKPTPSISMEQDSVDLSSMTKTKLSVDGRHDPCIVPRAVPCVEAAVAAALYDLLLCARAQGLAESRN